MVAGLPALRARWRAAAATAFGVRLVQVTPGAALVPPAQRPPITSPARAAAVLFPYFAGQPGETFAALLLDAQARSLTTLPVEITRGLLDQALVHPRELFRTAIAAAAHSLVIAHNHPSGDPTPSSADRMVTQRLVAAGELLEIPVRDHVILAVDQVGGYRYTSFAEAGLL